MEKRKKTEEEKKWQTEESMAHRRLQEEGFGSITDSPEKELCEFYFRMSYQNMISHRYGEISWEKRGRWDRELDGRITILVSGLITGATR